MSDMALTNAVAYAARHGLQLVERPGFGIHGTVHVAQSASNQDVSALKALNSPVFYHRELAVYERLREAEVTEVLGFHVPQLIRADDDLSVIQMTIVTRPFVLDFAGCSLGVRPQFSPEIFWSKTQDRGGGRGRLTRFTAGLNPGSLGETCIPVWPRSRRPDECD
jgi:hypothetical protein